MNFASLSNTQLIFEFTSLAARERTTQAELLAYIIELDARKVALPLGYESLFVYLVKTCNWAEGTISKRLWAARTCAKYPMAFDLIRSGVLHIEGLSKIARLLTPDNHATLLAEAAGKSKRELEKLVAKYAPRPDVPERVRKLPSASQPKITAAWPDPVFAGEYAGEPLVLERQTLADLDIKPKAKEQLTYRTQSRVEFKFTGSEALRDKIDSLKGILSNKLDSPSLEAVIELAVDTLLEKETGPSRAPSREKAPRVSAYIPKRVRAKVRLRDGNQCAFRGRDGTRCTATHYLQFDHLVPRCRGGVSTAENLRLLCRAHNQHEADRLLGTEFMARKRAGAQSHPKPSSRAS